MNKSQHVFLFLCVNVCLNAQAFESGKSWKVTGEYFESLYFNSLQENLKDNGHKFNDSSSLSFLKKALYIYEQRAKEGDVDAQFRLGVIYEASIPSQIGVANDWYQKAAAQGHSYAIDRLKHTREANQPAKCDFYSNTLLTSQTLNPLVLFHVESLALLGYEDCMLALGQWYQTGDAKNKIRSLYWLQRAALTLPSSVRQGEILFELALALEEKLGSEHKTVVSFMERASRYNSREALGWFTEHFADNSMLAYASFLKSRKQTSAAEYMAKSFFQNSTSWNENDRYKAMPARTTAISYPKDLNKALKLKDKTVVFEVIGSIAEALVHEVSISKERSSDLIDSALALYDSLLDEGSKDLKTPGLFVQFLRSDEGSRVDKEKQFLLLRKSFAMLDAKSLVMLNQEHDIVGLVASRLPVFKEAIKLDRFLRQIEGALLLRRTLLPAGDVEKLDLAFRHVAQILNQDEAALKIVLLVAKEKKSSDLFLLFFKNLFANELAQLDILMQVEDLLSGFKWSSNAQEQTSFMVEFLAGLPGVRLSALQKSSFDGFPKLMQWHESGFLLDELEFGPQTSLFADSILTLQVYAQALKNYKTSGRYVFDYELATTLSAKHIDAVKNGFESRLSSLHELTHDFKQNRNEQEYVEDAQVSKNLFYQSLENNLSLKNNQVKQYVQELLATQKTLDAQLNYAGLYGERKAALLTSTGLRVFQRVTGESDDFTVSASDAKMSSVWKPVDNSPRFSHHSIVLARNDVLNIQVSGEWSATCALQKSAMVKNAEEILVGPEGFRTHMTNGDTMVVGNEERNSVVEFSTRSETKGSSVDWAKAAFVTVGAAAGFILGGPPGMMKGAMLGGMVSSPFSVSSSSQETSGTTKSSENSHYKQRSNFESNTAAFQSGIRLVHTPYPQLPAGAYVAIVVSREGSNFGEVIQQLVLQAHSSFVAPQDSEVFFVVNDCNEGRAARGLLTVHLQKLQPASNEMLKLVAAMERNLNIFSQKGEALIKEGGDLNSRIETLKADVIADLQINSIVDFMSQPTLRNVFLQWLHHEADCIVRKARIAELIRNIYIVKLEMAAMENQLTKNAQHENQLSARLSRLVSSAKHLEIYDSILDVVQYAKRFLMPILQIYYPENTGFINKAGYRPSLVDEKKKLDLISMADTVKYFSKQILSGLSAELITATTEEYVMVRLPRPGVVLNAEQLALVPVISEERAQLFWDHLFGKGTLQESWGVKIAFEDLYQDVSQARLLPTQEAPIIIDMVLLLGHDDFFATEHLQTQFQVGTLDMLVGSEQVFPLLKGPKKLVLSNDDLRSYKINVGFVNARELAIDALRQIRNDVVMNLNTAKGLSPFSTFSFAKQSRGTLQSLQKALELDADGYPSHLTDVFIVMKVASTNRYSAMKWLNY